MQNDSKNSKLILIKNGIVVYPSQNQSKKNDVLIENGIIIKIDENISEPSARIIDAKGLIVSPGFIDMHAHLREPGFEQKEDIESGSKSAVAGGFTTILCMPNSNPANDCEKITKQIVQRSEEVGLIKVLPVGAISKNLNGEELTNINEMKKAGVIAISDDGSCVQNDEVMKTAMMRAKDLDLLVIDHPEDFDVSSDGLINDGAVSKQIGVKGISRLSENKIIERDIALARETGAKLHIAHLSTKEGVELVRQAKKEGLSVTCEVTPHHLTLTEDEVLKVGTMAKVNPPLRTREDVEALIEALSEGVIDVIATDHAPHEIKSKECSLESASFGISGFETMLPLLIELVLENRISLEKIIALITSKPAQILNLNDRGALKVGNRGDVTIFDPNEELVIDSSKFFSKGKNTPFDGWKLQGKVKYTIVSGKIVFNLGTS